MGGEVAEDDPQEKMREAASDDLKERTLSI
jgi:hypothetical protein